MKAIKKIIILTTFSLFFISCSKNDDSQQEKLDPFDNYTSQFCTNVLGAKALYWDLVNGVNIPLQEVPILANIDGQFIHSQVPYLGFPMPAGYQAFEITDPNTQAIGVNVIRNDNNVVWRYIPTVTFSGNVNITDIIAFEINQIMDFHGVNISPEVLCTETRTIPNGQILTNFTARQINFGDFTATVWVQTLYFQDLNLTFSSLAVISGPSNEYDNLIKNIYLPLTWQLLVGPERVQDSDLDGYPDDVDPEPNNPSVP